MIYNLHEQDHSYDNIGFSTAFQPAKKGDTFRVFHGFRDLSDAVLTAKYGLSGRGKANRVYSYEADNNPKGLFVTLSFNVATEFVGAYTDMAIIEFRCTFYDLDAPTWPGGSYTVQGQMSQYWGHGASGRAARAKAQKALDAEVGKSNPMDAVKQSDKPYLASLLFGTREYQSLYIGDLNPKDIIAFHVKPKGAPMKDPWEKISREEFIKRYGSETDKLPHDKKYQEDRIFAPDEDFDEKKFVAGMKAHYGKMLKVGDDDNTGKFLKPIWDYYADPRSKHPAYQFADYMQKHLWPRQMPAAFNWFKRTFRHMQEETIKEDAPVNCAGGGAIAGIGIGPKGEPGVDKRRKKIIMGVLKRKKAD